MAFNSVEAQLGSISDYYRSNSYTNHVTAVRNGADKTPVAVLCETSTAAANYITGRGLVHANESTLSGRGGALVVDPSYVGKLCQAAATTITALRRQVAPLTQQVADLGILNAQRLLQLEAANARIAELEAQLTPATVPAEPATPVVPEETVDLTGSEVAPTDTPTEG